MAVVSTLLLIVSDPASADHGENFHCDRIPFLTETATTAIKRLSHNRTMEVVVKEYAMQWEAQEIRRTCDEAAAGRAADFSCMQGRRNWKAIQSMIPDHLSGLNMVALRPHQLELQSKRAKERPHEMAYRYCESLGVIER